MAHKYKHTILLVEDEAFVIKALNRLFRKEGYHILTASSGQKGLELLKKVEKPVSLFISDQLMPGMTGVQFLEKAKKIFPDAIRFLLTGRSDMDAIVDAVNKGEIHRYLTKPWNDADLTLQVRQSLEQYELRLDNKPLLTPKRKHTIIVVDDEKEIIIALRRLFRKDRYQILAATSGQEGLELLKKLEKPVSLIISDQRMPGMNGAQFLERAKKISPDAIRFLLTGYSDMDAIVEAINKGEIHRYLKKPWNDDALMLEVRQSLEAYEHKQEIQEKNEELRQKDLQLIEMDRIAGIGDLAAGIAHEINNPLGFVKSSIGSLQKSTDKMIGAIRYWDDKLVSEPLLKDYQDYLARMNFDRMTGSFEKKFDRIQRGIERIIKIINSLRSFSRVDMEAVGKIDINQSTEDAIEILSTQDAKDVEFIKEFREVPLMECSPNEINQCLLHILKNALDAIDQKGTIKITTSYDEKEDEITIRIIDNGKGMSPEVLRQAQNPFFTTKPVGSGTGVGLSLTERIIKRHGGNINISSKEDEGTTVTMTLAVAGE